MEDANPARPSGRSPVQPFVRGCVGHRSPSPRPADIESGVLLAKVLGRPSQPKFRRFRKVQPQGRVVAENVQFRVRSVVITAGVMIKTSYVFELPQ